MPKTVKNVYDDAVTFEKLLKAHKKSRMGKREKKKVILFELKLEQELLDIEKELKNGTYKHQGYTEFKVYEPKERKIKDRKLLWLTRNILMSTEGMVGLPLGNYTSQMFANIYLNELDQYAKHGLKCKYYFRYMDDIVIVCENKKIAQNTLKQLSKYLEEKLKLTLNSKTKIFKGTQGVNFCGYKINENRMKIKNSSKYRMKRKLKKYTKELKEGKITLPEIQRSIAGWLGYVKHADSYNLRKSMFYIEG